MSKEERRKVYKEGYEQGRFDERMDSIDNRPPTEQEVCDSLKNYGKKTKEWDKVWYKNGLFYADEWTLCYMNKNGGLELSSDIDPKSHILLGRFYEGKANDE
jgi:DNA-directed RNA polymerase specialized sigma subunit